MFDPLTKQAISHTLHCLLGCSIGEVLGMALSTAWHWSNFGNIWLSIVLAFGFGYLLTFRSLTSKGAGAKQAIKAAIAIDTVSITSMEMVDNIFILLVPGAINAGLNTGLFWISLVASLVVAFILTVPVNRFMISRRIGHNHQH